MEAKIAGYLEEYVRHLRLECDALLDRYVNDQDEQASLEADGIIHKITDIRTIIRHIAAERARRL